MVTGQASRLTIVFIFGISAVSVAWARYSSDLWPLTRRSFCGRQGESCYSTDQCCKPFVCAAFDEMGTNPEIPGLCMREKDLKPCTDDVDCKATERCSRLDGVTSLYCVPRPAGRIHGHSRTVVSASVGSGGLGSACVTTADCRPFTDNGEDAMCCQRVQLGRQGAKQICDRQTSHSACIVSTA